MNRPKSESGAGARGTSKFEYGPEYYENAEHFGGHAAYSRDEVVWQNHFQSLARRLVADFAPKRVLDVGCAKGFLVERLRDLGVEAFGVDGSEYAISQVREDVKPFCRVSDATEPPPAEFGSRFDLVTCIEVAEHLEEQDAAAFIANLCRLGDEIVFSSTPSDFAEPSHLNVRPPEYWLELFAKNGFFPNLRFDSNCVTPWAIHFRRLDGKLKVAVFNREKAEWAVVRLRLLDPLRELERQGRVQLNFVCGFDRSIDVEALLDSDLFIIGREFAENSLVCDVVAAARAVGKVVVWEIDDFLFEVPRSNPVWSHCMRIAPDLQQMIREADFITCSTQPLADGLARHEPQAEGKCFILENVVNPEIWGDEFVAREPSAGRPLVVGWFGSATHHDDLKLVEPAIRYLSRKYAGAVEFQFFGFLPADLKDVPGVRLVRGGQPNVVKHAAGVRDAEIHVAIAPLTAHPFNDAKSDLKWLEYSICGIPGVYSDVAPYRAAVTHGVTGLVCENTTEAWVAALERMIQDGDLRRSIARAAFDAAKRSRTTISSADRWDRLYRSFLASGPRELKNAIGEADVKRAASFLFQFQARLASNHADPAGVACSLEAAISLDGERAEAAAVFARGLAQHGYVAAADRVASAVTALVPECALGHRVRVALLDSLGETTRLLAALDRAARFHPSDPDLFTSHVAVLGRHGDPSTTAGRIAAYAAAAKTDGEVIATIESLHRAGHAEPALELARRAADRFTNSDFRPLVDALVESVRSQRAIRACNPASDARRVVVFTHEPMSSRAVHERLLGPLSVLEQAGEITVRWDDGSRGRLAIEGADLVVLHRRFVERGFAEPLVVAARERGIPIVAEIDEWIFDQEAQAVADKLFGVIAADAVTVPTDVMREVIAEILPDAKDRVVVLETGIDGRIWSSSGAWSMPGKGPLRIALFTGHCEPDALRAAFDAVLPLVRASNGALELVTVKPFESSDAPIPSQKSILSATPFYVEHALRLAAGRIDVALVPATESVQFAARAPSAWMELSACRVPGIFGAALPFSRAIASERDGILVDGRPESWSKAIARLVASPSDRRRIAESAAARVFADHSTERHAVRWRELYELLIGAARAAASAASDSRVGELLSAKP